ncbi:hypothetical protein [Nitrospirillum viridazoti]|uniref:DUF7336 domain-containing protein n=1 Tax=Nitrospirillum amazonense TaxID=28077 RepID=A0A560J2B0_9PROT|nr:hypothetical protein [Nitrospirillum amazonense]TWB63374.1 hypothetical protein FBZ92_104128 [Nitrospirillum amazonense]
MANSNNIDVFSLWLKTVNNESEVYSLLGIFSSDENARAAMEDAKKMNSYSEVGEFEIFKYKLDYIDWCDGFISSAKALGLE